MDLLEALNRPEGKTLEFKGNPASPNAVPRTIVAFANSAVGPRLAALVERGLLHEVGSSPQDPKRRYFQTEPT